MLLLATSACVSPTVPAQTAEAPYGYARSAPLAFESTILPPRGAIRLSQVSYASPTGGRVTGQLALPTDAGRRPAVVLLHGLPGNASGAMSFLGIDMAQRGAVVLAIDAPWVRRGGLPDFTPRDSVEQVQLIVDLQRAVDVLMARDDVDPARIGFVGGSYGGAMGAALAGVESRLRAAILFVADGGLVAHFTDDSGNPLGPLASLPAETARRWLEAMRPIEPIRFVHRARVPLLFQNGRSDPLVTVEDAEALHRAAGQSKDVRWYDAGHNLGSLQAAREDRTAFLARELGLRGDG
jgi:cephalosporin-C deacetylase-like acetyl esterase